MTKGDQTLLLAFFFWVRPRMIAWGLGMRHFCGHFRPLLGHVFLNSSFADPELLRRIPQTQSGGNKRFRLFLPSRHGEPQLSSIDVFAAHQLLPRKQRLAEQRRKRAQSASGLAQGAKTPLKAVSVTPRPQRPPVGLSRAEPLPAHSYPVTRAAIGKRQVPGGGA